MSNMSNMSNSDALVDRTRATLLLHAVEQHYGRRLLQQVVVDGYIQHPKVSIISNSGSTHVFHQCGRCHNYGHTSTTCVQLLKGNRNKQYLGPGLSIGGGGGGGHKRGVMKMDRFLKMMARYVFVFFCFGLTDACVLF